MKTAPAQPTPRRLLAFKTNARGATLTPAEMERETGVRFSGTNLYFGVNSAAAERVAVGSPALLPSHEVVVRSAAAAATPERDQILVVGLWPFEAENPFEFLVEHLDVVRAVAAELEEFRMRAGEGVLRLVIRYASEMNDPAKPGHPWGRRLPVDPEQAEKFRMSYREVRRIFADLCPDAAFTFSPALRRDNAGERYALIKDYWPGDGLVDIIGCTWYVGRTTDYPAACEVLHRYHHEMRGRAPRHAIDEAGGASTGGENTTMLGAMLNWLSLIEREEIRLDYLSLFLNGRWGAQADLLQLGLGAARGSGG